MNEVWKERLNGQEKPSYFVYPFEESTVSIEIPARSHVGRHRDISGAYLTNGAPMISIRYQPIKNPSIQFRRNSYHVEKSRGTEIAGPTFKQCDFNHVLAGGILCDRLASHLDEKSHLWLSHHLWRHDHPTFQTWPTAVRNLGSLR